MFPLIINGINHREKMRYQKYLLLFIVFIAIASNLEAQRGFKRWIIIEDSEDKIVYIDTTSIKLNQNLLSVWALIKYREPVLMNSIQHKVKKSKSHFLFNTSANTYNVVGVIFYDEMNKIVGETTSSLLNPANDDLSLQVESGSSYELIMIKAREYATTGRMTVGESEYIAKILEEEEHKENKPEDEEEDEIPYSPPPADTTKIIADNTEEEDNSQEEDTTRLPLAVKENGERPRLPGPEPEDSTRPFIPLPPDDEGDEKKVVTEETKVPEEIKVEEESGSDEYDATKEKQLRNFIFTDGNLYCYQVMSLRKEKDAQKEVDKLKNKGFNAFYVPAKVKGRQYYRVRIGYFNSQSEADKDRRKRK